MIDDQGAVQLADRLINGLCHWTILHCVYLNSGHRSEILRNRISPA